MNKIKIIDLLNMISKGEEVPNLIKYQCVIGKWNNKMLDYMYNDVEGIFDNFICTLCNNLNNEVEIIEEQEEIDIQSIRKFQNDLIENTTDDGNIKCLAKKCNELVQAVKQLDRQLHKTEKEQ